jgi:hypothetical protein
MYKKFRLEAPKLLLEALFAGAMAWIEEQAIPTLEVESTGFLGNLGSSGVCRADFGGGISCSEDSGLFPGVKHREYRFLRAVFAGGTEIMAKVGQVKHRRGCSICLTLLGDAQ